MRSKNFSWRYSLAATVLLLSPFDLLASLGMDMYLPAVPFMPNALGTTASTIQLTLTTYLVMIGAGQLFVWTAIGPTGAPPRSTGRWPRLRCGVNGPRSYVIG